MKKIKNDNKIVLYQNSSGAIELRGDIKNETIWANLNEISSLFGRDKSVISRHIKDIFEKGELIEKATVAKNATVQIESDKEITPISIFIIRI